MNIKIPADFTLTELRAFIEGEACEAPPGYYTTQEWADHFKIGIDTMRKLLNKAKKHGLLEIVWVRCETLNDRMKPKPHYALQGRNEISDSHKAIQTEDGNGHS